MQTENALYTDLIIDLFKYPLNKRAIVDADITHSGANVTCGDHLRVYLRTDHTLHNNSQSRLRRVVRDASFEGYGCAISMAAASLLTEEIKNQPLDKILLLQKENVFEWLGVELGPSRVKCGLLCLETMQEGIRKKLSG